MAVLLGGAAALPFVAHATSPCKQFETELDVIHDRPGLFNRLTWDQYHQRSESAFNRIADGVFDNYIEGKEAPREVYQCFSSEEKPRIKYYLSYTFLQKSLDVMTAWHLPHVGVFAAEARKRFENGRISSFEAGPNPDASADRPGLKLGGFHKGNSGLYLDPNVLPSDQWFLIFFHELSHAMDDRLTSEVSWAQDPSHFERVMAISKKGSWAADDSEALDRWIMNGLNRAFLAEYRAWAITADLYVEARKAGKLASIPWFDRFIGPSPDAEAIHRHIFDELDRSFADPDTPPFDDPRVKARLAGIRERLRTQASKGDLPGLGSLQEFAVKEMTP